MSMTHNQEVFQTRLERLNAVHADRRARTRLRESTLLDNLAFVSRYLLALGLGVATIIASRYVQFHMAGPMWQQVDADTQVIMDNVIGAFLVLVLRMATKLDNKELAVCNMLGIWAMILGYHNAVHLLPEVFSVLFTPEYVYNMIARTEPYTLMFRDTVFTLKAQ